MGSHIVFVYGFYLWQGFVAFLEQGLDAVVALRP